MEKKIKNIEEWPAQRIVVCSMFKENMSKREAHCYLQFSLNLALVLALKNFSFIHFIGVNTMITRFVLKERFGEDWLGRETGEQLINKKLILKQKKNLKQFSGYWKLTLHNGSGEKWRKKTNDFLRKKRRTIV